MSKSEGIETILKNVIEADKSDVIGIDAFVIGSPNYNHTKIPTVIKFSTDIK